MTSTTIARAASTRAAVPHQATTRQRADRAAATQAVQAVQAVQKAVQQSMDRRDNGGETGH